MEIADFPNDHYRGGCLKGLSYPERIYNQNRIKTPMRRVGERGAGEWEAISWDEAIQEAAAKIKEAVDQYGPTSVLFDSSSGQWACINGGMGIMNRLCGVLGATKLGLSYDGNCCAGLHRVLGTTAFEFCNDVASVMDASLFISWGTNPVMTQMQNWRWFQMAKDNGTRTIQIDIIKSMTSYRCDESLQVTPGNDGYLALAMANYVIQNGLQDTDFIMEKTTGPFLVRRDTKGHLRRSNYEELAVLQEATPMSPAVTEPDGFYVWDNATNNIALIENAIDPALEGTFTTDDGVVVDTAYTLLKNQLEQYTIEGASDLCGLDASRIEQLATEIATEPAVTINFTFGTDHYPNGYQAAWAIGTLVALCGQIARPGAGFVGTFLGNTYTPSLGALWAATPEYKGNGASIPNMLMPDILNTQQVNGRDCPTKVMITSNSNMMSNIPNQAKFIEGLPNLGYWIVVDMEMTDSARWADLLLPCASWFEVEDVRVSYANPYMCMNEKAIEPLYESKSDWEIAGLLGRALGYEASFPEAEFSNADYAFQLLFSDEESQKRGYTPEFVKSEKVINYTQKPEGYAWIRGLDDSWPTESGRLQFYCEFPMPVDSLGWDLSDRVDNEHLVYFQEPDEVGHDNPLAEKYPLTFVQEHSRFRTHTQLFEVPLLRELDPEPLGKVNKVELEKRGIADGDYIEVFNDRGHVVVKSYADESITPGIISIPKGWQRHQFKAGSYQELSNPKYEPYGGSIGPYDTRCDFRKWEEE